MCAPSHAFPILPKLFLSTLFTLVATRTPNFIFEFLYFLIPCVTKPSYFCWCVVDCGVELLFAEAVALHVTQTREGR